MLVCPGIAFLMPPRTGTTWVNEVMQQIVKVKTHVPFANIHTPADITSTEWRDWHYGHPNLLRVLLRRESLPHLRSLYHYFYKSGPLKEGIPCLRFLKAANSEQEFIAENQERGLLTFWNWYMNYQPTQYIHTENIAEDLLCVLELAGYDLTRDQKEQVMNKPPANKGEQPCLEGAL